MLYKVLWDTDKPHCGQKGQNNRILDLFYIEICQKVKYI